MYARFVSLRLVPGAAPAFVELYRDRIAPTLAATPGCLAAVALAHSLHDREILSLTFWRSGDDADAYDREGRFGRLLNETERLFPPPSGTAELGGLEEDLVVEGYAGTLLLPAELAGALREVRFARTIAVQVEPKRTEEFDRRYRADVLAAAGDLPGLRSVFLLHGQDRPNRAVGLSFWESEDLAARYELSGRFEALAEHLGETLSPLYRWRAAVANGSAGGPDGEPAVAAPFEVAGYRVLFTRLF